MITFKQQITVQEELVTEFAQYLGWQEGNISAEEYINQKSKQHMADFFLPFGYKLVNESLQQAREQLQSQIIQPVVDALATEVEKI
jgi:hypothetical protein